MPYKHYGPDMGFLKGTLLEMLAIPLPDWFYRRYRALCVRAPGRHGRAP